LGVKMKEFAVTHLGNTIKFLSLPNNL